MSWEWYPETPEEIAEHQRMRKNFIECQQMSEMKKEHPEGEEAKSNERPCSILVALAVVILLIYFLISRS